MRDRRRARQASGRLAETLAGWWLRCKGYRILAHNWKTPMGEIDLIARRGNLIAVVEVKHRPTEDAGLNAIRPKQRERIERAALAFLGRMPGVADLSIRFDVMLVTPYRPLRHLQDAWRPEKSR